MVINHASTLSKEYFKSYIKLIMNAENCSLDRARELTFQQLFKMNKEAYGKDTYENLTEGYKELKGTKI